jgi:hypothetical protein
MTAFHLRSAPCTASRHDLVSTCTLIREHAAHSAISAFRHARNSPSCDASAIPLHETTARDMHFWNRGARRVESSASNPEFSQLPVMVYAEQK